MTESEKKYQERHEDDVDVIRITGQDNIFKKAGNKIKGFGKKFVEAFKKGGTAVLEFGEEYGGGLYMLVMSLYLLVALASFMHNLLKKH